MRHSSWGGMVLAEITGTQSGPAAEEGSKDFCAATTSSTEINAIGLGGGTGLLVVGTSVSVNLVLLIMVRSILVTSLMLVLSAHDFLMPQISSSRRLRSLWNRCWASANLRCLEMWALGRCVRGRGNCCILSGEELRCSATSAAVSVVGVSSRSVVRICRSSEHAGSAICAFISSAISISVGHWAS
uniref:Uncharacterized protein n=1 Tax=Trichuris muris TaxID=70415 RepID=A0A5S6QM73_TRIMR